MRISELLRLVWMNLSHNKFKVILTAVGIIVGSATIMMVLAIGTGGKLEVAEQFKNLNAGAIDISYESNATEFGSSGGGFGGKGGKGGRGNRGRDNNRRGGYRGDRNRDDRDGGRRDFKRKSKKNSRDFENRGNKRPHRTSSEKKNGFVIRNKGDK